MAAVIVVWFIWNKTTFGKNLYAVGGNPEAASVSGISVFKVTVGAFVMAGISGCRALIVISHPSSCPTPSEPRRLWVRMAWEGWSRMERRMSSKSAPA